MSARRVYVGGASGFVGSAVCRSFFSDGFSVTAISRSPPKHSFFHRAITWDQLVQEERSSDPTAVVNCSGENVLNPIKRWNWQFEQECQQSRFGTAEQLGNFAQRAGANVFVQVTGIHACPTLNNDIAKSEDGYSFSDSDSKSYWRKFVHNWEDRAIGAYQGGRMVFIRPGVVLGKEGGAFPQMSWQFYLGLGGVQGDGTQLFPWIHIQDLADAIKFTVENQDIQGGVHAVAPQKTITNREFTDAMGKAMQRPTFFPTPEFVFRLMFGNTRMQLLFSNPNVVPKKLNDHGFQFKYPNIDQALENLCK